jgi:hypothetical protein
MSLCTMQITCHAHIIFLDVCHCNVWGRALQITKFPGMHSSPFACFHPSDSKYYPLIPFIIWVTILSSHPCYHLGQNIMLTSLLSSGSHFCYQSRSVIVFGVSRSFRAWKITKIFQNLFFSFYQGYSYYCWCCLQFKIQFETFSIFFFLLLGVEWNGVPFYWGHYLANSTSPG